VPVAPEADDRRRCAERFGEVRQRRDPDPAADEERAFDVQAEAVAERAEDAEVVAGLELAERTSAGADRVDQERQLAGRRETQAERPREQPARRLEHEELAGGAGIEAAAVDAEQRVWPDCLG
jgi:hypothetical protein